MNSITLTGNLVRDVELSETANGTKYAKMTIAVNRKYPDAQGNKAADFFDIIAWRTLAENCAKYLSKGKKIAVEGSVIIRSYEDKNGITRKVIEVIADDVEFLSPKTETVTTKTGQQVTLEEVEDSDNLPF